VSGLAGAMLIKEFNAAAMPTSLRETGKALGARMCAYPKGAFTGVDFLIESILQRTGVQYAERTIRYDLAALKRLGYIKVRCCAGDACVGGRHHAARYVMGPRRLGGGWRVRGRFVFREKGAQSCTPRSRDISLSHTNKGAADRAAALFHSFHRSEPATGRQPDRHGGTAPPPGPARRHQPSARQDFHR
jgi:hypothetical protein